MGLRYHLATVHCGTKSTRVRHCIDPSPGFTITTAIRVEVKHSAYTEKVVLRIKKQKNSCEKYRNVIVFCTT